MKKNSKNEAILSKAVKGDIVELKKLVESALASRVVKAVNEERKLVASQFLKGN